MKKLLYGSTALVAAGLLSGTAAAEEGIDADISGGWLAQFASVSQDDGVGEGAANRRDHGFTRFGTITIAGDTTLDNGLQVGVAFDWNTENGGPSEVQRDGYGWMEFGGFRVEFGARNSAAYQMAYSAPGGGGGHGFNSPVFQNATTPATNDAGASFGQVRHQWQQRKGHHLHTAVRWLPARRLVHPRTGQGTKRRDDFLGAGP